MLQRVPGVGATQARGPAFARPRLWLACVGGFAKFCRLSWCASVPHLLLQPGLKEGKKLDEFQVLLVELVAEGRELAVSPPANAANGLEEGRARGPWVVRGEPDDSDDSLREGRRELQLIGAFVDDHTLAQGRQVLRTLGHGGDASGSFPDQ